MSKEQKVREARFDKAVFYILTFTLTGFLLMLVADYVIGFANVWAFVLLTAGVFASAVCMLLKGAVTGKRYMQGAKHRREKWFPFLFAKNESLADDAFKVWNK